MFWICVLGYHWWWLPIWGKIYLLNFSFEHKIPKRKVSCLKFLVFLAFLVLWVSKAVKTTQLGRKSKTRVMGYVWRTQGHFRYRLAVDWHEANGLSITEIAVMAGTYWEPMRNTLCCPVFQSFLLLYLCRGASGKWSAYNYRCSTSH